MGIPSDHSPKHPFADTVDPDLFYRSSMHETVCAELFTAGKIHAGLVVLSGEPGTGKSTVLRRVARDLEQAGGRVLWCAEILSLHEWFGQVGGGSGVPDTATRAEALLATMQARVRSSSATVVVVDEAQRLESGELGILCDLAEAGRRSGRPLAVLLVGLPELDVKLAHLVGNKAGRASTFHARLSRLETPEVRAYMAYRLERVGLSLDRLFQAEAVERVAAYAEGIPRVINHLCAGALRGARESGLTMVSAPTVDAAAHWLDLPPPAGAPLTGAWRGTRRRLGLWAARGVLAGRRTMRAWSPGMGLAALGRATGGVARARRRLRLWAARGAQSGRRTMRAWSPGIGPSRLSAARPGAWRGPRRWLRLWAARGVLAGRRTMRAWSPGMGLAALGARPRAWRGTRRRLRLWAARGVLVRAPNDPRVVAGDGPRGSRPRGPEAWRGTRRRLRLWAARGALAGRRTMRAWSPGMGLAALGRAVPGAWRGPRRWLRLWAARGALCRAPNDSRVVAGDGPRGSRPGSNRGVLCAPTDATAAVVASAAGGTSARQAVEAAPARARSRRADPPAKDRAGDRASTAASHAPSGATFGHRARPAAVRPRGDARRGAPSGGLGGARVAAGPPRVFGGGGPRAKRGGGQPDRSARHHRRGGIAQRAGYGRDDASHDGRHPRPRSGRRALAHEGCRRKRGRRQRRHGTHAGSEQRASGAPPAASCARCQRQRPDADRVDGAHLRSLERASEHCPPADRVRRGSRTSRPDGADRAAVRNLASRGSREPIGRGQPGTACGCPSPLRRGDRRPQQGEQATLAAGRP